MRSIIRVFVSALVLSSPLAVTAQAENGAASDRFKVSRCDRLYRSEKLDLNQYSACRIMMSDLMPGAKSAVFKAEPGADLRVPKVSREFILWLDKMEGVNLQE